MFDDTGAIDTNEGDPNATDPQGSAMGNSLQQSINAALAVVNDTLSYGRRLHGLGGGGDDEGAIKTADRMPAVPGNPSESGVAKPQPFGTLPRTGNPFGKRADAMPRVPGNPSESGVAKPQPFGTLPPTSNPFGKRAEAEPEPAEPASEGAIDTDDEEAA